LGPWNRAAFIGFSSGKRKFAREYHPPVARRLREEKVPTPRTVFQIAAFAF